MITALTLSFIVMRSYWAIGLPIVLTVVSLGFVFASGPNISTARLVSGLDISATMGLGVGLVAFFRQKNAPKFN